MGTMTLEHPRMTNPPPISAEVEPAGAPIKKAVGASPGGWFTCSVAYAGPASDGTIYVNLTDTGGKFSSTWFSASPMVKREMLATALSALASGHQVCVCVDTIDAYGVLTFLYLTP